MSSTESILTQANELRKKLASAQKRISTAANDKIRLTRELEAIESTCIHDWTKPRLVPKTTERYQKECLKCGMKKESTNVQVKF